MQAGKASAGAAAFGRAPNLNSPDFARRYFVVRIHHDAQSDEEK
jgi:hypothetical protein